MKHGKRTQVLVLDKMRALNVATVSSRGPTESLSLSAFSVRSFRSPYAEASLTAVRCAWHARLLRFLRLLLPASCALCLFPACALAAAAADVHWLNSLEGGRACLLVDSYHDLCDGEALEEAFFLVEVCSKFWGMF